MKWVGILVCVCIAFCTTGVQAQLFTPQQQDSARIVVKDSVTTIQPDSLLILTDRAVQAPHPQDDSLREKTDSILTATSSDSFLAPSALFKPTPRKAVIYSALFPGLGQIYNRKYWKLPILYGGFVGFTYAITWNNGYYRDYLGAYQDIMDDNPETNRWHTMLPYGQDPETADIAWFTDVLQQRKDYYRYYRDLSIIGTVALYLLAMVDAYVDAQLFDFDMSPDLSMRVEPVILKEGSPGYPGNSSYGVQWSIHF